MSVEIVTFGCRLNAFESEVIAREAERAGLTDAIVVNSCAVTNEAVAQAAEPQALVSPAPRSQVRIVMWPRSTICASVILARSGKTG